MSEVILSVLRLKDVIKRTGLSRSTLYSYIDEGTFPKPFKIGERAVGWYEHEIEAWLATAGGYKPQDRYDDYDDDQ